MTDKLRFEKAGEVTMYDLTVQIDEHTLAALQEVEEHIDEWIEQAIRLRLTLEVEPGTLPISDADIEQLLSENEPER